MADWALLTGEPVVDDDVVAIPDVAAAEAFANRLGELPPAVVAQRGDGRTVHFYRLPAGWSS